MDERESAQAFRAARTEFRQKVREAKAASRGSGGVPSTGNQMFWASALFTRLVVTADSLLQLVPKEGKGQHWDFSAIASLTRNLVECYFVLFFLCFDSVDESEQEARFLMMHLHDNRSRQRMFTDMGVEDDSEYEKIRAHLTSEIEQNSYFRSLPPTRQREILKGDRTPFVQDDLLERMGVDRTPFRGIYRFFSAHTHTGPISYYHMIDSGSGTGVENVREKGFIAIALEFASGVIDEAISGMREIFPFAMERGATISAKDVTLGRHRGFPTSMIKEPQ